MGKDIYVLGIHIGHDSSASIIKDGRIIASAAEERFTRTKHFGGLPLYSVSYCLKESNIDINNVKAIAYSGHIHDKRINQLFGLPSSATYSIKNTNLSLKRYLKLRLRDLLKAYSSAPEYINVINLDPAKTIYYVPHHLAHAASSFYTSGNREKTLVVTSDGAGEDGNSLSVWIAESGKLKHLRSFSTHCSYGFFYSIVTEALGWQVGDGEGTTMGLAPYGNTSAVPDDVFSEILPRFQNGSFQKSIDFGVIDAFQYLDCYHWNFKKVGLVKALIAKYGRENIAAKAQEFLEFELLKFLDYWQRESVCACLASAGGVFLNVKLNQRIVARNLFKDYYIFPDAGDSGLSAGAALSLYYQLTGDENKERIKHLYWGPAYSDEEIRKVLDERQLNYRESADVASDVAKELAQGKIIGWFQGRMECGPRALGGRSILFDASKAENKDIINRSVKFRQPFRPFCPSLKVENSSDFLIDGNRLERFMITSYDAVPERKGLIPAVTHVDGTVRPQMVEQQVNPLFWKLLDEYAKLNGVPVLMNTSFNIKGDPIVCSPRDAIKCFFDTGIQVLALGNFILTKK